MTTPRVPLYQDNPSGLMRGVSGPRVTPGRVDASALLGQIDAAAAQEASEAQKLAIEEAKRRAVVEQTRAGAGELAATPGNYARQYADVFRRQVQVTHLQQAIQSAELAHFRIATTDGANPDGYAAKWAAYVRGTVDALAKDDPEHAEVVEAALNDFGAKNLLRVEQAALAEQKAAARDEFLATLRERQAAYADALLNSGDPEAESEAFAALEATAREGVAAGHLSYDQARSMTAAIKREMARERIFGEFDRRARANDIAGIEGMIAALERGKWFDNNDDARAMANELRSRLAALTARQLGLDAGIALKLLRQNASAAQNGMAVDPARAQFLADLVIANGTPAQAFDAMQELARTQVFLAATPIIEQGSLTQVQELAKAAGGLTEQVPAGAQAALQTIAERRAREIIAARNSGDISALLGPLDWRSASPESVQDRRVQAARVAELVQVQPDGTVQIQDWRANYWPRETIKDMAAVYRNAVRMGDMPQAADVLSRLLAPAGDNGFARGRIIMEANGLDGELAAGSVLVALGRPTDAVNLLAAAEIGRTTTARALAGGGRAADLPSFFDSRDFRRLVAGAALGDPRLTEAVRATLRDAYLGFLADELNKPGVSDSAARNAALTRFRSATSGLADVTELANGYAIPNAYLPADPVDRSAVVRAMNAVLQDPERLNLSFGQAQAVMQRLFPVPTGEGAFLVRDTLTGAFLHGKDGQPLLVNTKELLARPEATPSLRTRIGAALRRAVTPTESARLIVQIAKTAPQFGADAAVAEAIVLAADNATVSDLIGQERANTTGRLPAWAEVDEAEVRKAFIKDYVANAPRPPTMPKRAADELLRRQAEEVAGDIGGANLAPYAAVYYIGKLQRRYKDPRKAAAAYWVGPDVVDAAVQQYGDEWERGITARGFDAFMGRVGAKLK